MLVLIAIGTLVWIFSCVVVVCVCAMAARGDGRPRTRHPLTGLDAVDGPDLAVDKAHTELLH
ncbi:MAG: hypothetical protein M3376_07575 [Actinomycetota bacterium]|nr:hypothetical protein [Actinomycetota bacterium]